MSLEMVRSPNRSAQPSRLVMFAAGLLATVAAVELQAQGIVATPLPMTLTPPDAAAPATPHLDLGVGVTFGILGLGVEGSKLINDHIGVRAGFSTFSMNRNITIQSISYALKLKLQGVPLLVDLYPFARGSFHFSGGLVLNQVQLSGSGTGAAFTLNSNSYTAAQLGTLGASIKYPSAGPYFGLGFGTPARNSLIAFTTNFGVVLSKPTVGLTSTGGTASNSAQLQADLAAQQAKTQTSVNKLPVLPVLSTGIMLRF